MVSGVSLFTDFLALLCLFQGEAMRDSSQDLIAKAAVIPFGGHTGNKARFKCHRPQTALLTASH